MVYTIHWVSWLCCYIVACEVFASGFCTSICVYVIHSASACYAFTVIGIARIFAVGMHS